MENGTQDGAQAPEPEQTDNRPKPEDGEQLPPEQAIGPEWTGEAMR